LLASGAFPCFYIVLFRTPTISKNIFIKSQKMMRAKRKGVMKYICFKCGEEVKNTNKQKKEQLKCEHCGGKVVMKERKPTQYIAN